LTGLPPYERTSEQPTANSVGAALMRIAIFDYAVAPTNAIGRCHLYMLEALQREHDFTVFSICFENPSPELIRWVRIPAPTRPGALVFLAFHFLAPLYYWWHRLRQGTRFDLVQIVGSDVSFGDVSHAQFCNRTYLVRHWKQSGARGLRKLFRWLDHWLRALAEPSAYRRARHIVVPSQGLARELRAEYPFAAGKIRILPNPVDIERMRRPHDFDRKSLRQQLGLAPEDVALAFVALGHYERKGLPLLMQALAQVCNAKLKIVVVGGLQGLVATYRQRGERMGLHGQMVFTGTQRDVRPYLWATDGFAFPSHYEAFPLVALEAAAAGLPLVVTPLNGVEEFLIDGGNGILVERSVEGVCRGLTRLLEMSPQARREMGANAQRDVARYDTSHFIAAWRRFYADFRRAHGPALAGACGERVGRQ
jgi:glycosyltransferase involved in cell wall biosynthesis